MHDKNKLKHEIQELVHNWISWLFTRSFYGAALPENLQKNIEDSYSSTGQQPNARNDSLCCAFNLVLTEALKNDNDNALCFMYVYAKSYRPEPVKTLAYRLNIDSDTVYKRAEKFAAVYYNMSLELERLNSMMQREVKMEMYD